MQRVSFHRSKPFLFVATKQQVRVYHLIKQVCGIAPPSSLLVPCSLSREMCSRNVPLFKTRASSKEDKLYANTCAYMAEVTVFSCPAFGALSASSFMKPRWYIYFPLPKMFSLPLVFSHTESRFPHEYQIVFTESASRLLCFGSTFGFGFLGLGVRKMLVKKLISGCKWISCMDVHPSGDHLIVGSYDRRVAWFDLDLSSTPYKTLKYHTKVRRPRYSATIPFSVLQAS